jgi:peroxiredoxin Q/BCP
MIATDFNLPDQDGKLHKLSDYKGKWVVLYFYPKDDTPGCIKEACSFRDNIKELTDMGVVVLGISKDSVSSHKKFYDKYNLNFLILSDQEKNVINSYKAWGEKSLMGRKYFGILRTTYLIDPKGIIKKIYEKVNPQQHAEEIIKDIKSY